MPPAAILARYRREVDVHLRSLLTRDDPPLLYRMVRYHLGWEDADGRPAEAGGGKALRPSLCLLACQAVGGEWRRALPAAVALELVHNFSLVHDDIQDRDRERRHRPTVWSLWGEGQAINAGDVLLALAHVSLLGLVERGLPPGAVLKAARILDEATLEMVEGQAMDLSFEERLDVGLAAYLEMIEKKTGALFDASLGLGALVGGGDAPLLEAMGRCGRLLGVAFQLRDDMLGVWGAESQTGKEAAADIRRRKKSLPAVYALSHAEGSTLEELRSAYSRPELSDGDVSLVLRAMYALEAREYCRGLAEERKTAALAALDAIDFKSPAADELRATAAFLLAQDF
ncbi:MAG: polyprenyl synthetase family protein [Chloroflexi bacterium]|nr:polyprenyl synthetase family protein [Chloroflexota bacterium]